MKTLVISAIIAMTSLVNVVSAAAVNRTDNFAYNTDEEASKMRDHLIKATKGWTRYTAGIDGLVNKMIVQLLVSGIYRRIKRWFGSCYLWNKRYEWSNHRHN